MTRTHWPFGVRFACSRIICEPALQRVDAVPAQLEVVEAPAADGVQVRIVQPGNHAPPARVDHAGAFAAESHDLLVAADRDEALSPYGECLRLRLRVIKRGDLARCGR